MAQKFNEMEFIVSTPKSSSVDMSCSLRGTGKLGRIIPTHNQSLLPGETIKYTPNTLVRFAPLAAPLMSNMTLRHHCFSVPYRQLYANWEEFITGGEFNTNDDKLPSFTIKTVMTAFNNIIGNLGGDSPNNFANIFQNNVVTAFSQTGYHSVFVQMFADKLDILREGVSTSPWTVEKIAVANECVGLLMNMLVGTGSLLDFLGYPVRDYAEVVRGMSVDFNKYAWANEFFDYAMITLPSGEKRKIILRFIPEAFDDLARYNDALLRAYYRVWYYFFRDENRDKVWITPNEIMKSSNLAQRDVLTEYINRKQYLLTFLLLRPCSWAKDLANTSQVNAYVSNAFVPVQEDGDYSSIDYKEVEVFNNGNWETMQVPSRWLSQVGDYDKRESSNSLSAPHYTVTGFSLKNLQKVEALAKWLDKGMLGWTYPERLKSSFGINYSNKAMQLPEYEGGTKSMVDCQTLTNNTSTAEQIAGSQTGYAQGITANDGMRVYAEEHAIFLDLMSILPELSYKYSTPQALKYIDKFDFPLPEFCQLGEQVLSKDAVANSVAVVDEDGSLNNQGFGYVSRYAEATNNLNRLCGGMVEQLPLYSFTQDYTNHVENFFEQYPTLSTDFIHCVPSTDVFVSDSEEWEFVFDHAAKVYANVPLTTVQYV